MHAVFSECQENKIYAPTFVNYHTEHNFNEFILKPDLFQPYMKS